jgi:hypothetical protein
MKRISSRLLRDEQGNIIIIGALGVFLIATILAMSIDFGRTTMAQSDAEVKLSALVAQAGEEFTYWQIRKTVNTQATAMNLPNVQSLPADQYILPDASITETQAVDRLRAWVQQEMRKPYTDINGVTRPSYPDFTITEASVRQNTNGQRIIQFKAQQPQAKNFYGSNETPRKLQMDSAALVNTLDEKTVASQIVFSLDKDSLDQLGSGPAAIQAQTVFDLAQRTITALALPTNRIVTGLTIGNVPMAAPNLVGATGTRVTSEDIGVNIQSNNLSYTGGLYDDVNTFTGTSIGTGTRNFGGHRTYTYEAEFEATDAAQCANPVWTYRNRKGADCMRMVNWEEYSGGSYEVCTPPPPPTPPTPAPNPCIAGEDCSSGGGSLYGTVPGGGSVLVVVPPEVTPRPAPPPSCSICNTLLLGD